jgi:hypothetical protein
MTMFLALAGTLLAAALATTAPAPPAPPAPPAAPAAAAAGQRCDTTTQIRTYGAIDPGFEAQRAAIDDLLVGIAERAGMSTGTSSALRVPPGTLAFAVTVEASRCAPADAWPRAVGCPGEGCGDSFPGDVHPEGSELTVTSCTRRDAGVVTRASTSRRVDGRWVFQRAESALADVCPDAP